MLKPDRTAEAIEHVMRLRRAEAAAGAPMSADLGAAREFIEQTIGSTVRAATAARLLHISQTALNRWLDNGEIASVLTPEGRREIPLDELLAILDEAERLGVTGSPRPLAAVVRARKQRAEEAFDLDRLLPRRKRTHRAAELQSLAYHRLVAERLDDRVAEEARRRLARWRAANRIHPHWADEWERVLALPRPQLRRAISADSPRAAELRQTSPFAGVLDERERRALSEAVERRMSG